MALKLRDLVELLDQVAEFRAHVEADKVAISHGGSHATMARKMNDLAWDKQQLENLLDTEISI